MHRSLQQPIHSHLTRDHGALSVPFIDLTNDNPTTRRAVTHSSSCTDPILRQNAACRLLSLPQELQLHIFQDIRHADLWNLRLASRQTHQLVTEIIGKLYFAHRKVHYIASSLGPTESQRQLARVLASVYRSYVEQITFVMSHADPGDQEREKRLERQRKKEEWQLGDELRRSRQQEMLEVDYSKVKHITINHRDGAVHDFITVIAKATSLETFRLHGVTPSYWPNGVPLHLAPCHIFRRLLVPSVEVDEVISSFSTTTLTKVDIFYTKLFMNPLIEFLARHRTLSTVVLHCSTLYDYEDQWPDLVNHIQRDLTSLGSLSIKALHIVSIKPPSHTVIKRVSDLELEGRESIEARCRELIEEIAVPVLGSSSDS